MIERDWIDVFQASATPAIALFAVAFTGGQVWSDYRRRKNELFDRRYSFYKRLERAWLSTHREAAEAEMCAPEFELEEAIALSAEGGFLFGPDIAGHVSGLIGRSHAGSPFFPDENFIHPFRKYLSLR